MPSCSFQSPGLFLTSLHAINLVQSMQLVGWWPTGSCYACGCHLGWAMAWPSSTSKPQTSLHRLTSCSQGSATSMHCDWWQQGCAQGVEMRCAGFRLLTGSMAAAPCASRASPAAAQPPIAESQPVLAHRQRAFSVWRAVLLQVRGMSFVTPAGALLRPLMHWEPAACRVDWACPCQRSDRTGLLQSWAAGAWHSSDQRCGVYQAVWECPAFEPGFHRQGLPWRWAEAGNTESRPFGVASAML